ncbi:MAG: leucine--tRNA ligase [Chitinophagaceae bacterium]|nr:leucine--tRNA ligase [Chitinophagaceae bacterium]
MDYNFRDIEKKWQQHWKDAGVYKVSNESSKPKYYVLDMFPYPSGTGLHVGHPLGYIASDIFSRYKRLKGFNVLHPMGFDSFGLPAEQYALDTGQHPAETTKKNIATFKSQLDNIGLSFDWSREVWTSDPKYYKWTQWIFLQLFNSWYNRATNKTERINSLTAIFEKEGNEGHACPGDANIRFSGSEWKNFSEKVKMDVLMEYRVAYCGVGEVNWCEALGTVLANDEVVNGVSERGGFPVVKKKLRQWYLRITEYADRLLSGLETVDFSEAMKEMQANWIGKSSGAEMEFELSGLRHDIKLRVYTTRPDTIFGVDFMVIAPEHELVEQITSAGQKQAVEEYVAYVKSRSERERMAEKKITGVFTGAYALNPFNKREIPIWVSEYVLAGYGTGAIMAVPCGDERDHRFAEHFGLNITNIIGKHYDGKDANPTKDAVLENSDFLNGIVMRDAIEVVIRKIEQLEIGVRKTNYKMRDAAFSRQRYWGEPFPIQWIDGIARALDESQLPVELPIVESYKPGPDGEGPLANIPDWTAKHLETNTMPGYAGSSWYFLRFMDPYNDEQFCDRMASDYWKQVDLYIGGTEHAVGHLLYSRMWTKCLFDLDYIGHDEPFKRLLNQGMIQGSSRFAYRVRGTNKFVSAGLKNKYDTDDIHVDVNIVDGFEMDIEAFKKWRDEYKSAEFLLEDGKYITGSEVEKMSKSKYNTVNPDDLVAKYGADTFRMYEMFLGPVEMSKPWDTKGIEGVHRFLRKLWRLFFDETKGKLWTTDKPTEAELKVLHRAIRKIEEDTARFSFNTAVSAFMIAVNELTELKSHKKDILEPLLIILTPYAPHIAEELYQALNEGTGMAGGGTRRKPSILDAAYPIFEATYVTESSKEYPISINGKLRTTMNIALDAAPTDVEKIVLENEIVKKWLEGKPPKKVIFVKGKMVNVVV